MDDVSAPPGDAQARLAALERDFAAALEAEKLAALAELAAGAGHEMNNPLAVISGRAQLLLRSERDPQRRRELALIHAQAMRVHEMIADLMLFARPPELRLAACDLSALVTAVLAEVAPLAEERQVELLHCGRAPTVQADAGQLAVALRAMCDNALEALTGGGRLEVSLSPVGEGAQIALRDNGPGIDPQVRRHLFDPFYSGRGAGRGLGIGLSKCWRIITRHGGRIEVQSEPGHGAAFLVWLPAQPPRL